MAAPASLRPYAGTDAVLACLQPEVGSIAGEVSDGVLECITPVCERTGAGDRGPRPATRRGWRARRAAGDGCAPAGAFRRRRAPRGRALRADRRDDAGRHASDA